MVDMLTFLSSNVQPPSYVFLKKKPNVHFQYVIINWQYYCISLISLVWFCIMITSLLISPSLSYNVYKRCICFALQDSSYSKVHKSKNTETVQFTCTAGDLVYPCENQNNVPAGLYRSRENREFSRIPHRRLQIPFA